jgi:hypothetical protein
VSELSIDLKVRILMCKADKNDDCIVVGEGTDRRRISIPPTQIRTFRSVIAYYDLPKLETWKWDYQIPQIEAIDE